MDTQDSVGILEKDLMDALVAARQRNEPDEKILKTMFYFSSGVFQVYFGDEWSTHFKRMIDELGN